MAPRNCAIALALVASSLLAFQTSADQRYEFSVVYDGYAVSENGVVQLSTTGSDYAADWFRDRVVNNGFEGGSDYQMDLFRDAALEFFSERFGVVPNDPFLPDFNEEILVGNDSKIVAMVEDASMSGRVSVLRRLQDTRYLPNATLTQGGYYLIVGMNGLPAGGTYGMPLHAGYMAGYGQLIVDGICPVARNLVTFECTGKGGLIGELRIDFQHDVPIKPMLDQGWNYATSNSAQMYPIMMSLRQRDKDGNVPWGTGSCSGIFYGAARSKKYFNIMSGMTCNFDPSNNYNGFK